MKRITIGARLVPHLFTVIALKRESCRKSTLYILAQWRVVTYPLARKRFMCILKKYISTNNGGVEYRSHTETVSMRQKNLIATCYCSLTVSKWRKLKQSFLIKF